MQLIVGDLGMIVNKTDNGGLAVRLLPFTCEAWVRLRGSTL